MNEHGVIVVGVDGSSGAREALQWALGEARLRRSRLIVIHAWAYPYSGTASFTAIDPEMLRDAAHQQLERVVKSVDATDVEMAKELVEGSAARALIEAGKDADLVVVGSRGRGGFAGLLLGSVSQQVAHHAPCPVVIVPPTGEE